MRQSLFILIFALLAIQCTKKPEKTNKAVIKADEIIAQINAGKKIFYENKLIDGALDFTKVKKSYIESRATVRHEINSPITFLGCRFNGKIIAATEKTGIKHWLNFNKNLTFIDCEFDEELLIKEASVAGIVNFSQSKFRKKMYFEGVHFKGRATYFRQTEYRDKAIFHRAVFEGDAIFMNAVFNDACGFQNIIVKGNAQFNAANFNGYAEFSKTICFGNFAMNEANVAGTIDFTGSRFFGDCRFYNTKFAGSARFNQIIFYGETDFTGSEANQELLHRQNRFVTAKSDTFHIINN